MDHNEEITLFIPFQLLLLFLANAYQITEYYYLLFSYLDNKKIYRPKNSNHFVFITRLTELFQITEFNSKIRSLMSVIIHLHFSLLKHLKDMCMGSVHFSGSQA